MFALLAIQGHMLWFAMPLIIVVSLVYAATRHEEIKPILTHALRFGTWITIFMAIIMVVLWALASLT